MRHISRRQFLGLSLAGILGLTGFYIHESQFDDVIVSILRSRLSYLNLGEIDLHAFADEFISERGNFGARGRLLALADPILEKAGFLRSIRDDEIEEFEYHLVSRFLLSTDFFWNDSDESRVISYLAYNNPYRVGCLNPFAQFEESL